MLFEEEDLDQEASEFGEESGLSLAAAVIGTAEHEGQDKVMQDFENIEALLLNLEPEDVVDESEEENEEL